MAVVSVTATDVGDEITLWEVPPEESLNYSYTPRALRGYRGTQIVPALGIGDETNVAITFTFPSTFVYLPKTIGISFQSDDLTSEFSNIGAIEYDPAGNATLGNRRTYQLRSEGPWFHAAANSVQTFEPIGTTWRQILDSARGDQMVLRLSDISGDASTAGDVYWYCDFWEFDRVQCLKWGLNTAQPVFAY